MKTIAFLLALIPLSAKAADYQPNPNRPTVIRTLTAKEVPAVKSSGSGFWLVLSFTGGNVQVLPAGVYKFVFISSDPTTPAKETVIDATGSPTPAPPNPPAPVVDLKGKLDAALALVTDAGRVDDAATLGKAFTASVTSARATPPQITQAQVVMVLGTLGPAFYGAKPTWKTFFDTLNEAAKAATSLAATADVLQVAVDSLAKVK